VRASTGVSIESVVTVRLTVEFEEVPGQGWVVEAPEVAAVAQGETRDEALANLRDVIQHYPEVLARLLDSAKDQGPELELIPA
jgi:predicted RNase H-like HicB family nuclease